MLVSLSVFSIAAMALLNLKGESAQTVGRLEARALAGVVAENRMIELMSARQAPGLGVRRGEVRMAGRAWAWSETVFATDDADLRRVEISVELGDEGEVASLTAFRSLQ
ncbi:MAG: type II secretion system minor pseudopilin GspI [Sphingomonadales bacterium]|nr:type II secretion system minor pseudopilin GspI [Sphingomonadales bacterium]